MEIRLQPVDHSRLPEGVHVSVRVGECTKQGRYEPSRVYQFPDVDRRRHAKIDVFQHVGSSVFMVSPDVGDQDFELCLDSCDPQFDKLRFKVDLKTAAGRNVSTFEKLTPELQEKRAAVKTQAQEYIDKHGITDMMSTCMKCLLRMQPDDPIDFVCSYLRGTIPVAAPSQHLVKSQQAVIDDVPDHLPTIENEETPNTFSVGQRVRIVRLKGKHKELNGKEGTLLKFDEKNDRWKLRLLDGPGKILRQHHLESVMMLHTSRNAAEKISLQQYMSRMKTGQRAIYYVVGQNWEAISSSPRLAAVLRKQVEVLISIGEEHPIRDVHEFNGREVVSIMERGLNIEGETVDDLYIREALREGLDKALESGQLPMAIKNLRQARASEEARNIAFARKAQKDLVHQQVQLQRKISEDLTQGVADGVAAGLTLGFASAMQHELADLQRRLLQNMEEQMRSQEEKLRSQEAATKAVSLRLYSLIDENVKDVSSRLTTLVDLLKEQESIASKTLPQVLALGGELLKTPTTAAPTTARTPVRTSSLPGSLPGTASALRNYLDIHGADEYEDDLGVAPPALLATLPRMRPATTEPQTNTSKELATEEVPRPSTTPPVRPDRSRPHKAADDEFARILAKMKPAFDPFADLRLVAREAVSQEALLLVESMTTCSMIDGSFEGMEGRLSGLSGFIKEAEDQIVQKVVGGSSNFEVNLNIREEARAILQEAFENGNFPFYDEAQAQEAALKEKAWAALENALLLDSDLPIVEMEADSDEDALKEKAWAALENALLSNSDLANEDMEADSHEDALKEKAWAALENALLSDSDLANEDNLRESATNVQVPPLGEFAAMICTTSDADLCVAVKDLPADLRRQLIFAAKCSALLR